MKTYTLKLKSGAQLELTYKQAERLCAYEYLNKGYAVTLSYELGAKLLARRRNLTLTGGDTLSKEG